MRNLGFVLIFMEMQAKLAAQKLAERLNIKMQSYNPEGDSSGRYREKWGMKMMPSPRMNSEDEHRANSEPDCWATIAS